MKTMLPVLFFTAFFFPILSYAGPVPPVLDFTADQQVGCMSLTATFSDQTFTNVGDDFIAYLWDFGDGNVSTVFDPNPVHTYTLPGVYNVTMAVVSRKGWTGSLTKNGFIVVGSNFSVNIGPDTVTCVGKSITLDATTPGSTYLWSEGSNTAQISTLLSGQVSVIVTKDGCNARDTLNITRNPLLTADFTYVSAGGCSPIKTDFTQTSSACGGSVVSYAWDFGDSSTSKAANPSHTYALPGSYPVSLTVTKNDGTNFTSTKSINVTGFQTPVVDLGPDQILCDGSAITLSSGNPAADVISWSTGETTSDITIFGGGLYTVSVTKNGCTAADSVNITWKPELWSNFGYAKVGGCMPVDMQFTDSSTSCSGTIIGWLWDFGDGSTSASQNPIHTFTSKGQFPVRLTITGSSGSTISHTRKVTINPPVLSVNLGPDTTICFGESLTLDAANPGASYAWNTGDTSQQITVFDNGAYSVTINMGGCQAQDTINVKTSVSALSNWGYKVGGNCLPVAVTFSDSSSAFCGQSVTSWNWDFGDGTTSTLANPVHNYMTANSFNVRLTVTSSSGSTASKTKQVMVSNTPFNLILPSGLKVCRGGSVALDAVITGAQYAWTPTYGLSASNVRNPTLTPSANSWYKVAVTKCSITASDSVFITMDSTAKPVIVQDGNSLKSPDAATFQWYLEGKLIEGAVSKTIRVDKAGYYTVKVANNTGCINQSDPYFYIPVSGDEKTGGGFRIKCSPNPTHGVFNILFSDIPAKAAMVTVYDAAGKRLMITSIQDHVNRMDISKFQKGLYFIQIVINTDRRIIPVVVQ